jgi:hypothetical protein
MTPRRHHFRLGLSVRCSQGKDKSPGSADDTPPRCRGVVAGVVDVASSSCTCTSGSSVNAAGPSDSALLPDSLQTLAKERRRRQ